ncbi:Uma2 family endonuclease [Spirulina sp. CS-785/01]|uniref:Uma2 family endonuclease n=1 Tax=Spirulina sp. CS-785/01 TaxID=3021716 RepID=UPI00232D64CF|nr:Uma2 family endonuclease [Spirulina sp. CS-785/01]MDB9315447.1 Uma2 family endonuclease [Spirulina sp. CS-785/01]
MYDLPSENPEDPGLPDEFHDLQPDLLTQTCQTPRYSPQDYFVASDLNLYYNSEHPLWYKRPDWFVVLGVRRSNRQQDLRLSYVIWQELVSPFLVVELASPGTENEDLGRKARRADGTPTKWEVYEQILQVPYYIIYDRYENQLRAFRLQSGQYEALEVSQGVWFEELELGLGLWQGSYEGVEGLWLRFYNRLRNWIPTPSERATLAESERDRERQEKEQTQTALEEERRKNQQLRERLAQLGIDSDSLS